VLIKFESQTIPLSKSIRDLLNENSVTKQKKERKPISWKSLTGAAAGLFIFALVGTAIVSIEDSPEQSGITAPSNSKDESQPSAAIRDGVEVRLKAVNGLSWVAVSDSTGTTQFSGRIRQGEERVFTDNQLLYLVIGNAGAINLTVNGEDIGVAGAVGEVLRLEFGPQASNQG
jgi:ribosomal protein S12